MNLGKSPGIALQSSRAATANLEPFAPGATQGIAASGLLVRLSDRVLSWFNVPLGYEDENGFHYGDQPAPERMIAAESKRPFVHTDRACEVMRHDHPLSPLLRESPSTTKDSTPHSSVPA